MEAKREKLKSIIEGYGKLAVAFSGGIDSTFLLHEAHKLLKDNVVAITVRFKSATEEELERTEQFCKNSGIRHICIEVNELMIEGFAKNPPDRCYICKIKIFEEVKRIASKQGINVVADGSNADDTSDYRPGMKALQELSVASPLMDAGYTKADIRNEARLAGLTCWDLPSSPCLASRIPYGEEITIEKLSRIEQGERYLNSLGFIGCRVRTHGQRGELCRIEVNPRDIDRIMEPDIRKDVIRSMKDIGYTFVSLDMSGFRSGSLNDVL